MIEVEIKIPLYRRSLIEAGLVRHGFTAGDLIREHDLYFSGSARDFLQSDEALRIRTSENLSKRTEKSFLTFKGRKLDHVSMTRRELETSVEDAGTMAQILISLGYEDRYPVTKLRQYYHRDNVTACVDQVEGLGSFLELEILIPDEEDAAEDAASRPEARKKALAELEDILGLLDCSMADTTSVSYLSMIISKQKRAD